MKKLMLLMVAFAAAFSYADESDDIISYDVFIDGKYKLEEVEQQAIIDNYVLVVKFANSIGEEYISNDEFQKRIDEIASNFSSQKEKLLADSEMKNRMGFESAVANLLLQDAMLDDILELNSRYFHTTKYGGVERLYKVALNSYGDIEWEKDAHATVEMFCEEMLDAEIAKPNATGSKELCSAEYIKRTETKVKLKAASVNTKIKLRYLGGILGEDEYFDHEEEFERVLKDDMLAALN